MRGGGLKQNSINVMPPRRTGFLHFLNASWGRKHPTSIFTAGSTDSGDKIGYKKLGLNPPEKLSLKYADWLVLLWF